MLKLLNKLLRKEEIQRGDGTVYLNRWTLLRLSKTFWPWVKLKIADVRVYVHKFTASDHTKCMHDHPNTLISFIFWNGYEEEYWDSKEQVVKKAVYKAPCLRKFPASHTHRVTLLNGKPAWSLVFMFPKCREWGFFVTQPAYTGGKRRRWVSWKKYEDEFGGKGGCE